MKGGFVYILASQSGVLYTGVTNSLDRRILQHRQGDIPSFSKRYRAVRLVYYERLGDIRSAIAREKQIKGWRRARKIALIESLNPSWRDLAEAILSPGLTRATMLAHRR